MAFAGALDPTHGMESRAAEWIEYLCGQLDWARDEIHFLRDSEDQRG
jgi:hypothetical protein